MPPEHTPLYLEEPEAFEVSPAAELHRVMAVISSCSLDEPHKVADGKRSSWGGVGRGSHDGRHHRDARSRALVVRWPRGGLV
jgi:hypothetical protein